MKGPQFKMLQLGEFGARPEAEETTKRMLFTYPMVKQTDMEESMRGEVLDVCVNACEKHATNNESAAKLIKETLDKRFADIQNHFCRS